MIVLLVPWILTILIFICFLFAVRKCYKCSVILVIIILLCNGYWHVFALHPFCGVDRVKPGNVLRVLSWNISCTDSTATEEIDKLIAEIIEQDADVVFLTEFYSNVFLEIDSSMIIHYPYKGSVENSRSGCEFYSRVPIDSCYMLESEYNGSVLRYDFKLDGSRILLFCLHLQSTNLVNNECFYPDSIQDKGSALRYIQNYKIAAEIRGSQASQIIKDIDDVPIIVMGDMNDVCGSPCMKVLADSGLKDAWWECGLGYGATIHSPIPYRIDHVMYGRELKLKGIRKVISKGLSDHESLVADFEFQ